jgi:hypothetical protein
VKSTLASVIGWLIAVLVAFWALGAVIGTIHWLLRTLAWLVLVGALVTVYLTLKGPPKDAD